VTDLNDTIRAAEKAALNLQNAMVQADMMREELGRALRQQREERHISLREVARQLNVSAVYVSDMERGNRNPMTNPSRLMQWVQILRDAA